MTELEQYINSYFGLNSDDLAIVASLFKPAVLGKGDYYLKAGAYCNKLSFISAGMLRVFVVQDGKEITQWISTNGYFVTDLASITFNVPARWNIQALSDVRLFTIDREDYDRIGLLVPKWHQMEKLFLAKCFTMMEDRIFAFLSMTAEQRYQLFFESNSELFNQVPLQYIASMLGMTPETFSRIRRKALT